MALLAILGIATLNPGVLARADEPDSGVPLVDGSGVV
jgi:hypothetical protein